MSNLIRAILVMSASGGILAVLLFAIKPFVRSHLPKSALYYLWLVVIATLLIPVSKLVTLPPASGSPPLTALPVNVVDRYAITSSETAPRIAAIPAPPEEKEPNYSHAMATKQADSPVAPVFDVFIILCPLGAAAVMLYYIISYTVFAGLYRRRNRAASAVELAMLSELCGNSRTPRLYRNPLAETPMLFGVFRPAIIMPDREYTDSQLRSVLLHELAHLRRKDLIVKLLSVFACSIHWFNPVVWFVRREIDRACELACDEAVIRNLDIDGKQKYGDTLIYIAADSKAPHAVLSTTMCEEKKDLKERLGAIMEHKNARRLAVICSGALVVLLVGCAVVLGAGRAANSGLIEFTAVYSDVTEHSRSITFILDGTEYSPYIVDGLLQSAGGSRRQKEIGFAIGDGGEKYRIFECDGYSIEEFIAVQDSGFMNPMVIYFAEESTPPLYIDNPVDREEEMRREIALYFEEPDSRLFYVAYPVRIDNDDYYKIEALGTLNNGKTYPIDIFAINPNNDNRYYWNGETAEFQIFYTEPTFACKTSPDKRLRIESVNMNLDGPSGLHALGEMRIINLSTGAIEWSGESYLSNYFLWSMNSRFVAAQYSGRQWTETIVIDINNYRIIYLPGVDDLREAFPDVAEPNQSVPLSMFTISGWESSSAIIISFEWTTGDDIRVVGKYRYDIIDGAMDNIEIEEIKSD